jgi:hypothetical protein
METIKREIIMIDGLRYREKVEFNPIIDSSRYTLLRKQYNKKGKLVEIKSKKKVK